MIISKKSAFYKFLDTNWFTQDERQSRRIPHNLCAFMRKVVGVTLINSLLGFIVGLGLLSMALATFGWFVGMEHFGDGWSVMAIMGNILWFVVVTLGITHLISKSSSIRNGAQAIADTNSFGILVGWMRAVHDKVCPTVMFK